MKKSVKKAPGRPPKAQGEKLEQFSIRLPPKLKFGLEMLARAQHRSLSQAVEWAVLAGLNKQPLGPDSDYGTLGVLVDAVWPLSEPMRIMIMARQARSLLDFSEAAAADVVLRSVEMQAIEQMPESPERFYAEHKLMEKAEQCWSTIQQVGQHISIKGLDVEGESIDEIARHHAEDSSIPFYRSC